MAQIKWITRPPKGSTAAGDFTAATNWQGGVVPGAGDFADLVNPRKAYTVTYNPATGLSGNQVAALAMVAAATLDIQTGTLGVAQQFSGSGTVDVKAGAALEIGGGASEPFDATLTNSGKINLIGSVTQGASLELDASEVSLGGGGSIVMSGSAADGIVAATGADVALSVGAQTISGAGSIGGTGMSLFFGAKAVVNANASTGAAMELSSKIGPMVNFGMLKATGYGALDISSSIDNEGTVEAVTVPVKRGVTAQSASVALDNATVYGSGGVIASGTTASIVMNGASILQSVTTARGGTVTANSGTNTIQSSTISNGGKIVVNNGAELKMQGVVRGSGAIDLEGTSDSAGNGAILDVLAGVLKLVGHGSVVLGTATTATKANEIVGDGVNSELYNVNDTISGSGTIGDGRLEIVNGGTILSNGDGLLLIGGAAGAAPSINMGLIATANNDSLGISGDWSGSGVIEANGTSIVTLADASFSGGSLDVATQATVNIEQSTENLLAGAINNRGLISADDDLVVIGGAVNNSGRMLFSAGAGKTDTLKFDSSTGTTTFKGGGQIEFAGAGDDDVGSGGGAQTWSNVNNTISGVADIDDSLLTLINGRAGTIDATGGAGRTFTINTGSNAIQNNGVMEAIGAGGLLIDSAVTGSGKIEIGSGSEVELKSTWQNNVYFSSGASAMETLKIDAAQAETDLMPTFKIPTRIGEIFGFDSMSNQQIELGGIAAGAAEVSYQAYAPAGRAAYTEVQVNLPSATIELVFDGQFGFTGEPTISVSKANDGNAVLTFVPAS